MCKIRSIHISAIAAIKHQIEDELQIWIWMHLFSRLILLTDVGSDLCKHLLGFSALSNSLYSQFCLQSSYKKHRKNKKGFLHSAKSLVRTSFTQLWSDFRTYPSKVRQTLSKLLRFRLEVFKICTFRPKEMSKQIASEWISKKYD